MKAPAWVVESLFKQGLHFRNTTKCECGGPCELGMPPDCDQYRIATCTDCAKRWGIYLGKKK